MHFGTENYNNVEEKISFMTVILYQDSLQSEILIYYESYPNTNIISRSSNRLQNSCKEVKENTFYNVVNPTDLLSLYSKHQHKK